MTLEEFEHRLRRTGLASLVLALVGTAGCDPAAGEARDLGDACAEGAAAACNELGHRVQQGEHVLRDWRRAADLYALACDRGEPEGCVRLARLHVDRAAERRGVAYDSATAADLLREGCDQGAMSGCVELADMYAASDSVDPEVEATGPRQDLGRAADLYARACEGGEPRGCSALGVAHRDGSGVRQDGAAAATLFARACDDGLPLGCTHLGLAYETGVGIEEDGTRAASLYEEACAVEVMGCFRLADLLERTGSAEDHERVVELFDAACYRTGPREAGSPAMPEGCLRAGEALATGAGGARDLDRAARYFRRACNLGHDEACGRS